MYLFFFEQKQGKYNYKTKLLIIPKTRTNRKGFCLPVVALKLWNCIPDILKAIVSDRSFKDKTRVTCICTWGIRLAHEGIVTHALLNEYVLKKKTFKNPLFNYQLFNNIK